MTEGANYSEKELMKYKAAVSPRQLTGWLVVIKFSSKRLNQGFIDLGPRLIMFVI